MSDYENDGIGFDVWTYVARMGCRVRSSADPFFADGDAVCQVCPFLWGFSERSYRTPLPKT